VGWGEVGWMEVERKREIKECSEDDEDDEEEEQLLAREERIKTRQVR
jgi:hypothetical protein